MRPMKVMLVIGALAILVSGAAAQEQPGSSPDNHFIMEAAMGGMMEVELGKLATEKGASADVKAFGQRMVADHGKANEELMKLAGQKNVTLPTELSGHHKEMVDRLSKLSGAEFDREYMSEMVKDHTKDVQAFETEAKDGKDADVKAWAAKTVPTLRAHLKMAHDVAGKVGAKGM